MVVGCLEITFSLGGVRSLKEKRSIVRRLIERAKNRFNVSAAEVGANDEHRTAMIGFAVVANDGPFVNSVLDKVLDHIEDESIGRATLVSTRMELMHF